MGVTADYITKYSKDVIDSTANTGLFPSVMMAQGILESANGTSRLAADYNNHFGIKANGGWAYGKVLMPTTEEVNGQTQHIQAYFRSYPTSFDGFVDRNNFLKGNSRYANHGVFTAGTPEEQAQDLLDAGYATESNYASQLINLINQFNLKDLDAVKPNVYRTTTETKYMAGIGIVLIGLATFAYIKIKNR
jgi:mannosyl-glycoprotein endo-beta-N-acetylglucosaminidase/stage II sporulation protein P